MSILVCKDYIAHKPERKSFWLGLLEGLSFFDGLNSVKRPDVHPNISFDEEGHPDEGFILDKINHINDQQHLCKDFSAALFALRDYKNMTINDMIAMEDAHIAEMENRLIIAEQKYLEAERFYKELLEKYNRNEG